MAAKRIYNPPPNWPKPPAGWKPNRGWKPDPAWGAAPDGWEVWKQPYRQSVREGFQNMGIGVVLFIFGTLAVVSTHGDVAGLLEWIQVAGGFFFLIGLVGAIRAGLRRTSHAPRGR